MENINNVINEKIEGLCGTLKCCKYCDSEKGTVEDKCINAAVKWVFAEKPSTDEMADDIRKRAAYKMKNCCCIPQEEAKSESGGNGSKNGNIVLTSAEFERIINNTKHSAIESFSVFLKERFARTTGFESLCETVDDVMNGLK